MYALFKKELTGFLGSLLGYIVIGVFLVANGLVLWWMPFSNILDYGYATIDPLFINAPYVFLLLIPAITMRTFAEEKKTGTIETLFTKPISDLQIIAAKYLASLVLVIISLLPTLVYVYTVGYLANPRWDIDFGAVWGSYLGLLLLSSVYIAIGIFSSTLTDNQIISFIYSVCICLFLTFGLSEISNFNSVRVIDLLIINLGIAEHYNSISRGVIDSRDVFYFLGAVTLFLAAANFTLQRRKW
ncbi:MAG: gliding motility-associated ABC transporter permease subunit GldF [Flavobacteriales bacterium]|nr:gliding motility-associated ABC transporter permease subunit GldF [Flavobacteriales bacterium]